jgi:hypothetical protein
MDKREQALNEIKEAVPGLSAEARKRFADDYKWAYKYYLEEPEHYPEPQVPISAMEQMYRVEVEVQDIIFIARRVGGNHCEEMIAKLKEINDHFEPPHYIYPYVTDENGTRRRLPPRKVGKVGKIDFSK